MSVDEMQTKLHELWDQFAKHPYYHVGSVNTERAIIDQRAYTEWHNDPRNSRIKHLQYPWSEAVIMWTDYPDGHKSIKTNYSISQLEAMLLA